jgi:hypothetical protein
MYATKKLLFLIKTICILEDGWVEFYLKLLKTNQKKTLFVALAVLEFLSNYNFKEFLDF